MNKVRARKAALAAVLAAAVIPMCACSAGAGRGPGPGAAAPSSAKPGSSAAASAGQHEGSAAQGIALTVPGAWKVVDFRRTSVAQAYGELRLPGFTQAEFDQYINPVAKAHAVMAFDTAGAVPLSSGRDMIPGVIAYCTASGTSASGQQGLSGLREQETSEIQKDGGTLEQQQDLTIGGVPAVEAAYSLAPQPGSTDQAAVITAEPRPERECAVYVSYPQSMPSGLVSQISGSVTFP